MWLSSATRTGTVGTFTGNMAGGAGGVIALMSQQGLGTAQGSSTIRIGSEDVQRPQEFSFNRASASGSVLAAVIRPEEGASIDICSWNTAMRFNEGSGNGSLVQLSGEGVGFENTVECRAGSRDCAPGSACNLVQGNWSTDDQDHDGAPLLFATDGARLRLEDMRVTGNSTGDYGLFKAYRSSAGVPAPRMELHGLLVAGNQVDTLVDQCAEDCAFAMTSSTVADNLFPPADAHVFRNGSSAFLLEDSIVDQPWERLVLSVPAEASIVRVLTTAFTPFPAPGLMVGDPAFLDPDAGDYRLRGDSPAIDIAPAAGGADLYGRLRDVDIPWLQDGEGMRDLGAIETQLDEVPAEDAIFMDGFESV